MNPIQIDPELANEEAFRHYENGHEDEFPSEIEQDTNLKENMINIEGDILEESMDEDQR